VLTKDDLSQMLMDGATSTEFVLRSRTGWFSWWAGLASRQRRQAQRPVRTGGHRRVLPRRRRPAVVLALTRFANARASANATPPRERISSSQYFAGRPPGAARGSLERCNGIRGPAQHELRLRERQLVLELRCVERDGAAQEMQPALGLLGPQQQPAAVYCGSAALITASARFTATRAASAWLASFW